MYNYSVNRVSKLFQGGQKIAAIAVTPAGAEQLKPLCQNLGMDLYLPEKLNQKDTLTYSGSLAGHLADIWPRYQGIVFSLATGAVIRLIAPLLKSKKTDPAIIAIDPRSQYAICLCGGHQAGGEVLAELIAHQLGATPIITSASRGLDLIAIDVLGKPFGWRRGAGNWTEISAQAVRGEKIALIQDAGSTLWRHHLPSSHNFEFPPSPSEVCHGGRVYLTARKDLPSSPHFPAVKWHPRVLWVGIGCEGGTSRGLLEFAMKQVFAEHNLALEAIAALATIDIKAEEPGILELIAQFNLPLRTFPAAELKAVAVPSPSKIVAREVGTPSVAEAAALKACEQFLAFLGGASPVEFSLIVPKQIVKVPGEPGAVTVAVAQCAREYTGREGKLSLVGIGPGSLAQITPAAKAAIAGADAIVGYNLYLELISALFRPGQIVEAFPITQERQRAERAIELARWGLAVAVVSSGDSGIYGMAGLVLETLTDGGWDGEMPSVEVLPGITAMQAAAARVGAPLMHDFCAISLSDLLTPWAVIERRLRAAASADFVTAIYNPRSQNRTEQILRARDLFLQYRDENTPVAIVHSATRAGERVAIATLEKMLDFPIDMLTTIIIGNSSTRRQGNWLITPRGYMQGA